MRYRRKRLKNLDLVLPKPDEVFFFLIKAFLIPLSPTCEVQRKLCLRFFYNTPTCFLLLLSSDFSIPIMKLILLKTGRKTSLIFYFKFRIILEQLLRLCIRFFIGYWILKRGWISILALYFFIEVSLLAKPILSPSDSQFFQSF